MDRYLGNTGTGHFPGGSTSTGHSSGGPFPGSAPSPSNSGSPSSGGSTNNNPAPATSASSSSEDSGQTTDKPPAWYYLPMDKIHEGKILGIVNGTLRNGPGLVDGMVGIALHFNGDDDRQSAEFGLVPCFSDLEQCGDRGYSTAMWLRLDSLEGERYILSSGGQTGQTRAGGIAVLTKAGKLQVGIRSYAAREAWISSGLTVSPHGWFHLGIVWDGSVMKVYLNGDLQETVQASTIQHWSVTSVESKMYLGRPNNADKSHHYGKFAIDEWYYWNNLLSDAEIRNVMRIRDFLWDK